MPGPDFIPQRTPEEEERTRRFIEEITRPGPDIERLTEKIKELEREKAPA